MTSCRYRRQPTPAHVVKYHALRCVCSGSCARDITFCLPSLCIGNDLTSSRRLRRGYVGRVSPAPMCFWEIYSRKLISKRYRRSFAPHCTAAALSHRFVTALRETLTSASCTEHMSPRGTIDNRGAHVYLLSPDVVHHCRTCGYRAFYRRTLSLAHWGFSAQAAQPWRTVFPL